MRLLKLAGSISWALHGKTGWPSNSHRTIRRTKPKLESLEDRTVPTLLGQQLFPADNPWNQNIVNAPVAANSAAIISHIGTSTRLTPNWGADSPSNGANPLYGMPINVVHGNSTAKVNVTIDNYPGESDLVPVPIPANAVIEGDFQNGPNPNGGGYNANQRGDSHLLIWDEDNNIAYELYGVTRPGDAMLFPNTSGVELPHTDSLWHAAQESVWDMKTNTFRTLGETSADAAGLSIIAGLARPDEGLPTSQGGQGAINHALRVTLPSGDILPQYVYPASHMVSVSSGANKLPLGARLRLANTPAINTLIASMPPESQILARAMQQYGLIVADIGSAMYVSGASAAVDANNQNTLTWNLNDIFASNGLESLNAGDFEVVNLAPVVTGLSASGGAAGNTITITGQNFSGAAGRLSVFFGSTPATNVQVVSDTQITAVVPNGTGTVNVTVQSGVNATDNISSSPNANINAPIFGYGVSAITAADQFTYNGSPAPTLVSITVTPSNSTATAGGTVSFTATGTFSNSTTQVLVSGVSWSSSNQAAATINSSGVAMTLTAGTTTITATDNGVSGSTTLTVAAQPAPSISSISPATGPATGGTSVTINGANFVGVTGVSFGGVAASFVVVSATKVTATAPAGTAGQAVDITVTSAAGTSAKTVADKFTYAAAAPKITTQPSNKTVTVGQSATFHVVASGSGLSYQWQKLVNGAWVNVSSSNTSGFTGATTATFKITSAAASDAGQFRVIVSNGAGSVISNVAKLTVKTTSPPAVTLNPVNQTTNAGSTVSFSAAASGNPTPIVQWQVSAGGGAFQNITGATSTTLSFTATASQNGNQYRAVFTNSAGSATTSVATLTVNSPATPPTITTNPSSQTAAVGSTVTFTAAASGNPTPTVQWQVSTGGAFTNIAGATSTTLSVTVAASQNGAQFQAVFTNASGTATTTAATLTVTAGIVVGNGQTLEVNNGQTVTGVTVLPGGYLLVHAGGTEIGSVLLGGIETVEAGGHAIGTTVDHQGSIDADMEVFGVGTNLILNSGYINVDPGGVVNGTTINGDIMYVAGGGTANNTTIFAGGSTTIIGGGVANGTVLDGGTEWIRTGAVSNNTVVNNGGTEYVFAGGLSNNLTLNNGAATTMLGTVNGATINAGAEMDVFDGGAATGAIVDNGNLTFNTNTSITFAGQLSGNGTMAVNGNGRLIVSSVMNSGVSLSVGADSTLELQAAANSAIALGYQSTLVVDVSQSFTGTLTPTPGYPFTIDLGDVPYKAGSTSVQFVENAAHTQGVLTIGNPGGPTVLLTLLGNFSAGSFTIAADSQSPNPGVLIRG
jgi:autotransporter passenger strand-loop-strand repeat protein